MLGNFTRTGNLAEIGDKIANRQAKVGIIGLGYVGLPLCMLYAGQDFAVTGFDIDADKIRALAEGRSYIYRIPKEEIQDAQSKGFTATCDLSYLAKMNAIIICVPTPLDEHHEPDLSFIVSTAHAIAPHLRAGEHNLPWHFRRDTCANSREGEPLRINSSAI